MHFPVTNSTLSKEHLAAYLMEHYPLGIAAMCNIVKCGINDTYMVSSTEGKFIFRVYSLNWRTIHEINEEIRFVNHLKEQGISVSYPIVDNSGKYIHEFEAPEGLRYGVMFSYAEGEKLHNYSAEQHSIVGVLMANFHKVSENYFLQRTHYTLRNLLIEPLDELKKFLPEKTEEFVYMQSLQSYLLKELQEVNEVELSKGTVHMDIWFDNINISKDGLITLFDFDFCGNGWLAIDIAYYILQLSFVEREDSICKEKTAAFLEGYGSVRIISEEEKRILPMLGLCCYFFYLGNQVRRFDNWSNYFLSETYLKRYVTHIVKRYAELNGITLQ
jgi:Ser/Thr protein kinase RdoA (MazF antagonist)